MSPYYERNREGKLVPTSEEISEEVIRTIERADDDAIVRRMTTGIASQAFVYHYPIKTKEGVKDIFGISSDGADEIALMLGNIETLNDARLDKDSDPDYIYAMVRAKDIVKNVTLMGVGRQCKYVVGAGNQPDHDRIDEHAFVKSITKAQRNAILHLTPEEVVIRIISTFDKSGRARQIGPPVLETEPERPSARTAPAVTKPTTEAAKPAPAPVTTAKPPTAVTPQFTPEEITAQQDRLKQLRIQVHNKFQTELGISTERRKTELHEKFGVDSLTNLSEQQLRECLTWLDERIEQKTVKPPATLLPTLPTKKADSEELGFESIDEQSRFRGTLYTLLTSSTQLNLKDEEAKKFITDRGYTTTSAIPKNKLIDLIKEAEELISIKQTPSEF